MWTYTNMWNKPVCVSSDTDCDTFGEMGEGREEAVHLSGRRMEVLREQQKAWWPLW